MHGEGQLRTARTKECQTSAEAAKAAVAQGWAHGPRCRSFALADIDRIVSIWRECLAAEKGPFLLGASPCMADAMFAPAVTRFLSYDVKLDSDCAAYCAAIMTMPPMAEWVDAAKAEPDEVIELDVEF